MQLALEMMWCLPASYFSWLTPMTTVMSSPLPGAEMMTFFAPAVMWPSAFSSSVNRPVDSMTYSTPSSFHGSSAGPLGADALDLVAVDDQHVVLGLVGRRTSSLLTLPSNLPWVRVVLQQVGEVVGRDEVVDGDDVDVLAEAALVGQRAEHEPADATETVDRNASRHGLFTPCCGASAPLMDPPGFYHTKPRVTASADARRIRVENTASPAAARHSSDAPARMLPRHAAGGRPRPCGRGGQGRGARLPVRPGGAGPGRRRWTTGRCAAGWRRVTPRTCLDGRAAGRAAGSRARCWPAPARCIALGIPYGGRAGADERSPAWPATPAGRDYHYAHRDRLKALRKRLLRAGSDGRDLRLRRHRRGDGEAVGRARRPGLDRQERVPHHPQPRLVADPERDVPRPRGRRLRRRPTPTAAATAPCAWAPAPPTPSRRPGWSTPAAACPTRPSRTTGLVPLPPAAAAARPRVRLRRLPGRLSVQPAATCHPGDPRQAAAPAGADAARARSPR